MQFLTSSGTTHSKLAKVKTKECYKFPKESELSVGFTPAHYYTWKKKKKFYQIQDDKFKTSKSQKNKILN
jgi:hypothetical protein